ncbi:MAG: 3-carboxy-cis,cis-muconate cycloisomerase [Candidatus Acidiferrales bacterium]|jgi:3-carboxy-cis,cis-muconate cycloisomerase
MSLPDQPRLFDLLFSTSDFLDIFSDRRVLQGMLDFEAALARAEAAHAIIPSAAAAAIESQCRAELFDAAQIAREAVAAGNLAIPLVKALTANVASRNPQAARFVHFCATSQDAIDTGLILQLRDAVAHIESQLERCSRALAALAHEHKRTTMVGRTWMQQALPITFGLKVAGWYSAIERHRTRLRELRPRVLVLQLGGAAGTLAALTSVASLASRSSLAPPGTDALTIVAAVAKDLNLGVPDLPWHAERDRIVEIGAFFGLLTGTLGKIARDVSLLMQTEIAEVLEPAAEGRGVSSTMPHKRNPVGSAIALSAAIRVPALVSTLLAAMPQENERGMGNWHAEWETLPEIARLTAGALAQMIQVVEGLEVDRDRMAKNLDLNLDLVLAEAVTLALVQAMGRPAAHELVERACRSALEQKRQLRDVLWEDSRVREQMSRDYLEKIFDPGHYLGLAEVWVDRAVPAQLKAAAPSAKPK